MFFEPGAIVAQADSIQRRPQRRTDFADLVAGVAMVGLINHGALGCEIGRGQQRGFVLRREREDEERECV